MLTTLLARRAKPALQAVRPALAEPDGLAGLNLGRARARAALRTR